MYKRQPEDSEETHPEEDEAQEQDSQEKNLRAEDYEAMMQSVYQIAAETAKSVVTVRGEQDAANLTKDVNNEDMGCTCLLYTSSLLLWLIWEVLYC